jgi:hypothetical protein
MTEKLFQITNIPMGVINRFIVPLQLLMYLIMSLGVYNKINKIFVVKE